MSQKWEIFEVSNNANNNCWNINATFYPNSLSFLDITIEFCDNTEPTLYGNGEINGITFNIESTYSQINATINEVNATYGTKFPEFVETHVEFYYTIDESLRNIALDLLFPSASITINKPFKTTKMADLSYETNPPKRGGRRTRNKCTNKRRCYKRGYSRRVKHKR